MFTPQIWALAKSAQSIKCFYYDIEYVVMVEVLVEGVCVFRLIVCQVPTFFRSWAKTRVRQNPWINQVYSTQRGQVLNVEINSLYY